MRPLGGRNGDDELHGGSGDDLLIGGNHDDTLFGGGGADELYGGDGVDSLYGDGGSDWLDGGSRSDSLMGGADDDVLVWDDTDLRIDGGDGTEVTLRFPAERVQPLPASDPIRNPRSRPDRGPDGTAPSGEGTRRPSV